MNDQDIAIRQKFWSALGAVDPDVVTHLINPAFMQNMPKWPGLRQEFISLKQANGNRIIASDGLSERFDNKLWKLAENDPRLKVNGFQLEVYLETDEEVKNKQNSYLFDIVYQMSQQVAANRRVNGLLTKFGTLIVELYDVKAPAQFISAAGRVGVLVGLKSKEVPDKLKLSLSEISMVNIKLMTLAELDYSIKNSEGGRMKLQELFEKSSGTITNTTRPSVV